MWTMLFGGFKSGPLFWHKPSQQDSFRSSFPNKTGANLYRLQPIPSPCELFPKLLKGGLCTGLYRGLLYGLLRGIQGV